MNLSNRQIRRIRAAHGTNITGMWSGDGKQGFIVGAQLLATDLGTWAKVPLKGVRPAGMFDLDSSDYMVQIVITMSREVILFHGDVDCRKIKAEFAPNGENRRLRDLALQLDLGDILARMIHWASWVSSSPVSTLPIDFEPAKL